jgi:hypothetical protein
MGAADRLCALQVRVRRHHVALERFGLRDHRLLEIAQHGVEPSTGIPGPEPRGGGDLVVARPSGVKT